MHFLITQIQSCFSYFFYKQIPTITVISQTSVSGMSSLICYIVHRLIKVYLLMFDLLMTFVNSMAEVVNCWMLNISSVILKHQDVSRTGFGFLGFPLGGQKCFSLLI